MIHLRLAPSIQAAGLCQTLARLLYYTVPPSNRTFRTLPLPARFILPFIVILDLVAFFIQLVGLRIVVRNIRKNDKPARRKDADILRIGLILQASVCGAFAVLSTRNHLDQQALAGCVAGQRQVEAGRGNRELSDYREHPSLKTLPPLPPPPPNHKV